LANKASDVVIINPLSPLSPAYRFSKG